MRAGTTRTACRWTILPTLAKSWAWRGCWRGEWPTRTTKVSTAARPRSGTPRCWTGRSGCWLGRFMRTEPARGAPRPRLPSNAAGLDGEARLAYSVVAGAVVFGKVDGDKGETV